MGYEPIEISKLETRSIFEVGGVNLLSILPWMIGLYCFGLKPILDDPKHEEFKATLFVLVVSILVLWTILNELSDKSLSTKKTFIVVRIFSWLLIPAAVISLVVNEGVFQMRLEGIDSNLSSVPIIEYMVLILGVYEIRNFLRRDVENPSRYSKTKKLFLFLIVRILIILNISFCMYFVVSWGSWFRFINTGMTD
ncbi:MAG: hypothetical protein ACIAQZ_14150 [Sedimentisphaeraceae bacterium JB056]